MQNVSVFLVGWICVCGWMAACYEVQCAGQVQKSFVEVAGRLAREGKSEKGERTSSDLKHKPYLLFSFEHPAIGLDESHSLISASRRWATTSDG